jgi:hypothetical protein
MGGKHSGDPGPDRGAAQQQVKRRSSSSALRAVREEAKTAADRVAEKVEKQCSERPPKESK